MECAQTGPGGLHTDLAENAAVTPKMELHRELHCHSGNRPRLVSVDEEAEQCPQPRVHRKQTLEEVYGLLCECATVDDIVIQPQTKTELAKKLLAKDSGTFCLCTLKFEAGPQAVAIPEIVRPECAKIVILNDTRKYEYNERVVVRIFERQAGHPVEGIVRARYEEAPGYKLYRPDKAAAKRITELCRIHLGDSFNSWAQPVLNERISSIILPSRASCARAANGDICYVKLLNPEDRNKENRGPLYGRVIAIEKQAHKLKYMLLLCRIVPGSYAQMEPLCGTVPRITYDNVHAQRFDAGVLKQFKQHVGKGGNRAHEEYEARIRFANAHYVSLFNVWLDLDGQPQFRSRVSVKVNKENCRKLFLVCYSHWDVGHPYPLGKVVSIIDSNDFSSKSDLLHAIQFQLPHRKPEEEMQTRLNSEVRHIYETVSRCDRDPSRKDCRELLAVTIDDAATKVYDDAVSLTQVSEGVFEVGVHVTDASYYIESNSEIDKMAKEQLFDLIGNVKSNGSMPSFIPKQLSTNLLSLVARQTRKCLSAFFVVTLDEKRASIVSQSSDICTTLIRVRHNLTKEDVTDVIVRGRQSQDNEIGPLLCHLWSIAKLWRLERLGHAAFCQMRRAGEALDQNFEARCLVEELMVKANKTVAEVLEKVPGATYLVKVQDRPREADVKAWLQKYCLTVQHSFELYHYLHDLYKPNKASIENEASEPDLAPILDRRDFHRLRVTSDQRLFLMGLFSENQFSHLIPAIVSWYQLSNKAEYRVKSNQPEAHFYLDTTNYVQFTSPLRRYPDLLIHRQLRSALQLCQRDVDVENDLEIFKQMINERKVKLQQRNQAEQTVKLSTELVSKPNVQRVFAAVIDAIGEGSIRLVYDPETIAGGLPSFLVNPSNLGLWSSPAVADNSMTLAWNLRIYYHESYVYRGQCIANIERTEQSVTPVKLFREAQHLFTDNNEVLTKMQCLKKQLVAEKGEYTRVDIREARQLIAGMPEITRLVDSDVVHSDPGRQQQALINPVLKLHLELRLGLKLRVQLCRDITSELPAVVPQLVEFRPNLCVCLEHRSRPIPAFASHALEGNLREYRSVQHYSNVWLALLRMESAIASIADENSLVLLHVPITWHWDDRRKRHSLLALFTVSNDYCKRRGISFSEILYPVAQQGAPLSPNRLFIEASKQQGCSDYVCVRTRTSPEGNTMVLHGGIALVCKIDKIFNVVLTFLNTNDVTSHPPLTATVEVLRKPMPMLRQQRAVASLDAVLTDQLQLHRFRADNIIMSLINWNSKKNVARNSGNYFEYLRERRVKTLSVCVPGESQDVKPEIVCCNASQSRAITTSLKNVVSLIWGPPGTGKTLTGVLIAYWFSCINRRMDHGKETFGPEESEESILKGACGVVEIQMKDFDNLPFYNDKGYAPPKADAILVKVDKEEVPVKTRRQVLYCGPSNRSVDVVAEYLREKLGDRCPKIIRVFSRHFELSKYPKPFYKADTSRHAADISCSDTVSRVSLHEIIRSPGSPNSKLICDFDELFASFCMQRRRHNGHDAKSMDQRNVKTMVDCLSTQFEKSNEFRGLLEQKRDSMLALSEAFGLAPDPSSNFFDSLTVLEEIYEKLLRVAKLRAYQTADVILSTTSSSANPQMQQACRFSQIIIDEAGMCTQPEVLVPLIGRPEGPMVDGNSPLLTPSPSSEPPLPAASSYAERLVLLGDHKQLRPIVQCRAAERLGLNVSFMEAHQSDSVMLEEQYRMHPSLAEFPAMEFYQTKLITRPSPSWTGVDPDRHLEDPGKRSKWSGLNLNLLRPELFDRPSGLPGVLTAEAVNIFHGQWPGVRSQETCRRQGHVYRTLPKRVARAGQVGPEGEEDRLVFLHREGEEELSSVSGEDGGEFSRKNSLEIEAAVQVYQEIYSRLSGRRRASPETSVAIISQYRYQVSEIAKRIGREPGLPMPTVKTVIACQGSEFDYVILSLVRSCRRFLIPKSSVVSWELKYLGFITDENQINVALTRARRGLIIIGNSHLLRVNQMWNRLLKRMESRGCIVKEFPTGHRKPLLPPAEPGSCTEMPKLDTGGTASNSDDSDSDGN